METLKLDIVSDVVCPWCVIGYKRLERAIEELKDEMQFAVDWHPFELNPDMPPEGENIVDHVIRKYGITKADSDRNRSQMAEIGRELGFTFKVTDDRRIYNTFDAHRVLHWAREQDRQQELNMALFREYFTEGHDPSAPEVLARAAASVSLDGEEAAAIAQSERYADVVREEEKLFRDAGISAVPTFIVNQRYMISGAQEPAMFVKAFRHIADEAA